ncbi:response regulator [Reichenbachiella versicolor]|uniref:response regulator n=1 Tax=Reichenbachiella versicolor TaxID=1821036 RepID=UPI000D6E3E43|nr:response regulator transcription factor [Reichenbachiella versicolor]
MEVIKIVLADDHEIFRNGLKQLIDKEPDMQVIGEASNGNEALELLDSLRPDLIILDINMPEMNGLEAAQKVKKNHESTRIVIFSLYDNEDYVIKALNVGASGFLLKDTSNKIFLNALRAVHLGEQYYIGEVSDVVIRHLKNTYSTNEGSQQARNTADIHLSKREAEIINLIAEGKNSKQAADELGLSVRTVDAHRYNVIKKYSVNSIEEVLQILGRETKKS